MKRTWEDSRPSDSSEEWSNKDESEPKQHADLSVNGTPGKKYICNICMKKFTTLSARNRHRVSHSTKFICEHCNIQFSRKDNLQRHVKRQHNSLTKGNKISIGKAPTEIHFMSQSGGQDTPMQKSSPAETTQTLETQPSTSSHQQESDSTAAGGDISVPVEHSSAANTEGENVPLHDAEGDGALLHDAEEDGALQRGIQNRRIYPKKGEKYDLLIFLASAKPDILNFLQQRVEEMGGIKWNVSVRVEMERDQGDRTVVTSTPYFLSKTYILLNLDTLNPRDIHEALQKVYASMESYLREGSNWYVKLVLYLDIHTVVYAPLSGSSFMPLPKSLAQNRCVLNIRNQDDKCFLYCILASLHPAEHNTSQVENYLPYRKEINVKGIQFPVTLTQIEKFEKQNENISVNVFGYEENEIIPLRITPHSRRLHHVNLLWLKNGDLSHYCLITDLNGFLYRTKSHKARLFFCPYCLHGFRRERLLEEHKPYCSVHGAQKIELPIEGHDDKLAFTEFHHTLTVPFVIYADMETIGVDLPSCSPDPDQSSTTHNKKLEPCGYGLKVVCTEEPKYTKPTVVYRGPDASSKLLQHLLKERDEIKSILSRIEPMILTNNDLLEVENATTCCLCKQDFTPYYKMYNKPVRHHNHLTGAFIGMAHNHCNLNAKQTTHIPVLFHNLRGFDSHILCQSIGQFKHVPLRCIAQNSERYVSFSLGDLRFIDSFQFLPTSLESLVDDLAKEGLEAFPHVCSEFPDRKQASLLLRKGVYPYDYMTTFQKFDETSLPAQVEFYSKIKQEGISDEDYVHAERVWNEFNLDNLGQYHDLYLQTDVVLLCDVFETFRKVSMAQFDLDPCHFYTSPGLAWAACLKMTGVQLQLLTDINQMLFIEAGLRGGVSYIANRYKKANNPYLEDYDPSQPTSYLQYLDMNNLYGWAMVQKLPVDSFRFLDQHEIRHFNIHQVAEDDDVGYILEVSLHYPPHLHVDHNDYPLAPETRHIPDEILSPYARQLWKKLHGSDSGEEIPQRPRIEKLVTCLNDKDKYILHYRNLQLYLDLGMELKEIHRILQFRQEAWMRPFILYNTEQRKKATSAFQRGLYKLYNVSVFGKTMENVRKHKNIELVHTQRRLRKLSAKSTYKTSKIFSEDLAAVELNKHKVKLCKPSFCGMSILDLSKVAMYDFYYNHLKQKYGNKMQLLLTDTDSLLFSCVTSDIYKDMADDLDLYDTSDYPTGHFLQSNLNKKVLGKMKDETNGTPISEFVGLRSKMYSFRCGGKEEKKAKGISKVTVKKDLRFEHYTETLFGETQKLSSMSALRSRDHQLFCDTVVKTGLSAFDDKRYLMDAVNTLAYGHVLLSDLDITILK